MAVGSPPSAPCSVPMRRSRFACLVCLAAISVIAGLLSAGCGPSGDDSSGERDGSTDFDACTDECRLGHRQCAAGGYQPCGEFDGDPCLEWGPVVECNQGETCVDGYCQPATLTDECAEGSTKCADDGTFVWTCRFRSDLGIWVWGNTIPCETGQTCSCGVCDSTCVDECVVDSQQCSGDGYQVCADFDDDPCLDWGPAIPCHSGETCSDGSCGTPCVSECTAGATRCACSDHAVQLCGDFDSDPCLDWSSPVPCGPGETCLNGTCTNCPGITVGSTCVYLADPTSNTRSEAIAACSALAAGWDICDSSQICQTAVYDYLDAMGCSCGGGADHCACGSGPNVYFHALDHASNSYYIRVVEISGCSDDGLCTDSVSETCGAALCCR